METEPYEDKQNPTLKYLGIGCLSVVGVLLLVVIVGGIFVANNWRGWVAGPAREAITQALAASDLPADQQAVIREETSAFIDAFESGDITMEELGRVAEAFTQSPVMPMLAVYGMGETYIAQSGLSDEEKADANYQLRRAARGISERRIQPAELNSILEPLEPDPEENPGPQVHFGNIDFTLATPQGVDDTELREFIANVTDAANRAGVPDEDYRIDYAAEVRQLIETALGRELN